MKVNKTTYDANKNLTRGQLSNPFSNSSIQTRIKKSGAIDLKENSVWSEKNGYSQVKPIDKTKKLK